MMIHTDVKEVMVHRRGAVIQRSGKAELKKGINTLNISGITSGTDPNTIRFFFPEGMIAGNIRVTDPAADKEDDDPKPSDDVSEKITRHTQEIETLKAQMKLWQDNGRFQSTSGISIPDMENYIEKLPERLREGRTKIRELEKEKKKLEKQLSELLKEENKPYVSVDITSEEAGTYPFRIRYYERNAFWHPVYEIHSEGTGSSVEFRTKAKIVETTDEDWEDIKVTLVTGNPSVSSELPHLHPVYLSINNNVLFKSTSPSHTRSYMMTESATHMAVGSVLPVMEEDTAELPETAAEEAEVSSGETMTEYILSGNRSLISGPAGTTADLQKFTLDADYFLTVIPKEENRAFLTAEVKTSDLPVMSGGSASVYLKETFAGNININPDMTEETFPISLGADENVHVQRKELKRKRSLNMLKTQNIREHQFEIIVSSVKEEAVKLRVFDQIPVSRDKTITVDAMNFGNASHDETTGELKWTLELQPKQSVTLPVSYRISWPKDKNIRETSY